MDCVPIVAATALSNFTAVSTATARRPRRQIANNGATRAASRLLYVPCLRDHQHSCFRTVQIECNAGGALCEKRVSGNKPQAL